MILADGTILHEHVVEAGDIWRSASTKKAPIEDWVNLAISRQKTENCNAIFWLDADRAHDAELIAYVKPLLDAKGVADKFDIMTPRDATRASLEIITKGQNSIAITGQCFARLPHRSVPNLGTGHIGKNAIGCKTDERRRFV